MGNAIFYNTVLSYIQLTKLYFSVPNRQRIFGNFIQNNVSGYTTLTCSVTIAHGLCDIPPKLSSQLRIISKS